MGKWKTHYFKIQSELAQIDIIDTLQGVSITALPPLPFPSTAKLGIGTYQNYIFSGSYIHSRLPMQVFRTIAQFTFFRSHGLCVNVKVTLLADVWSPYWWMAEIQRFVSKTFRVAEQRVIFRRRCVALYVFVLFSLSLL